jgi:hypothetical protein
MYVKSLLAKSDKLNLEPNKNNVAFETAGIVF